MATTTEIYCDVDGNIIETRIVQLPEFAVVVDVPAEIQMWQARAVLIRMGLFDQVNDAVAVFGDREIQNAWEFAPNVVRRSAFLLAMAAALDLTDEALDNLFIEAAKIR